MGTKNGWFHQMSEAERLVELRVSIEEFQMWSRPGDGRSLSEEADEDLFVPEQLEAEDFQRLGKYVEAMKPFISISKVLGGDKYQVSDAMGVFFFIKAPSYLLLKSFLFCLSLTFRYRGIEPLAPSSNPLTCWRGLAVVTHLHVGEINRRLTHSSPSMSRAMGHFSPHQWQLAY